jgi:mannose-6-phosphate isomerase-like protein (cupin superfamily)
MTIHEFPTFVHSLPEADLPYPGLKGWLMQGEGGQVLYSETDTEVIVPEHSHGEQWGVVIRGRIELTIHERTRMCTRGDMYHIPSGAAHRAHIFPGFRAIDHYADRNRYQVKKKR